MQLSNRLSLIAEKNKYHYTHLEYPSTMLWGLLFKTIFYSSLQEVIVWDV